MTVLAGRAQDRHGRVRECRRHGGDGDAHGRRRRLRRRDEAHDAGVRHAPGPRGGRAPKAASTRSRPRSWSTPFPSARARPWRPRVDLEKTEASLRGQMRELEQRMTICLGATLVGTVVVGQRRRSGLAALRPSGSQFHSTAQERLPPARRDEVRFPDACRRPQQHVSACAA